MKEWFDRENPWAQQAIASTLLDAARKGFWAADQETLADVASFYLESKRAHGSGAGLRDAGSGKLQAFAEKVLGATAAARASTTLDSATVLAAAPVPAKAAPAARSDDAPAPAAAPAAPRDPATPPAPPRELVAGQQLEPHPADVPAPPAPRSNVPYFIGGGIAILIAFGLLRRPQI